jgi:hypothetical protein
LLLSMRYARRKKGPVLARSHPKKPARATQCRRSGRRYSHWFAREVVSNLALVAEVGRTADTGSLTLRWREMDSKFQFRDASPPPTAWAPSFRRVSGGSLSRRNSFIGLPSRRPLGRFRRADYRSAPTRPKPRNRCLSGAELKFRIHSPPPTSLLRTQYLYWGNRFTARILELWLHLREPAQRVADSSRSCAEPSTLRRSRLFTTSRA